MDPTYQPPVMVAQWSPGSTPRDTPVWVDLPRIVSVDISRGRQDELDTMKPATCTLVLGGHPTIDASLDPLDTSGVTVDEGLPLTPIRVRATYAGTTYTLFTGYVEGDAFTPVGPPRGRHQPVQVSAVDWLGWAAQVPLPGSKFAHVAMASSPKVFLTGELDQNPARNGDKAYNLVGPDGIVTTGADLPGALFETGSIVPGGTFPSFDFTTSGISATRPSVSVATGISPSTAPVCTVGFWVKTGSTGGGVRPLVTFKSGATVVGAVGLNASGFPYAEMRSTTGTLLATAAGHIRGDIDEPVLIVAAFHRASREVTVLMRVPTGHSTINTATAGGVATIAIGGSTLVVRDAPSFSPIAAIGEVAVFNASVPELIGGGLGTYGSYEGNNLWDSDEIGERLDRLFAIAGVNLARVGAMSNHLITLTPKEDSLAGEVTAYGEAFAGATFMTRAGALALLVQSDLDAAPYSSTTWAISDAPAGHAGHTTIRPVNPSRTGRRTTRVVNWVEMGYAQYTRPYAVRARDPESERRYGRRPFAPGALAKYRHEIETIPQSIIGRFARPVIEIGEVTVEPYGNHDATRFVLSDASELLKPVRYVETKKGSTATRVIDATTRIQSETFRWAETSWKVGYRLAPDDSAVSYP